MLIRFNENDFLIGIGVLCCILLVLWWKKRSFSYLLFFSIFWVYLLVVVQTVIFPIAITKDYSSPSINLVPFYSGYCSISKYCIENIVGNIILTIPFGFGINFLLRVKPRNFLWLAAAIGFGFEFSQLVISLVFRNGFRSIDINDVMLNATGVLIGYTLFRAFAWAYLKITEYFEIKHKWVFAEIYSIALQTRVASKSKHA
jgi:glycopeptide antibiotics resistance protein